MNSDVERNVDSHSPMTAYLKLPKNIGDVPSSRLFKLAHRSLDYGYDSSRAQLERITQPTLVAASALIEGVLVEANGTLEAVETHLGILDVADHLYRQVSDLELQKLEEGSRHPDDQTAWLRTELQCAFMDVYRDMACGEVTLDRTKPEIIAQLTNLNNHVSSQIKSHTKHYDHFRDMVGLQGELAVLTKQWQAYKHEGELIALPSTYRGGNGQYNRRGTHDIVFAQQSARVADEGIWNFTTAEVKRGNSHFRLDDLVRYTSPLIQVGYSKEPSKESIREVA